jgi:hypothetical protein
VRVRLKPSVTIHDPTFDWVQQGQVYEAEFSEKMTSPKRVVLIHPEHRDVFAELPFRSVEILPEETPMNGPCPVCGTASGSGYSNRDATVVVCPHCGGYLLAGTALKEFETGALAKPDPERFRQLVRRKRGGPTEYPVITSYDIDGIL